MSGINELIKTNELLLIDNLNSWNAKTGKKNVHQNWKKMFLFFKLFSQIPQFFHFFSHAQQMVFIFFNFPQTSIMKHKHIHHDKIKKHHTL